MFTESKRTRCQECFTGNCMCDLIQFRLTDPKSGLILKTDTLWLCKTCGDMNFKKYRKSTRMEIKYV